MLLLVLSFLCRDIVTSLHFSLIYTGYQWTSELPLRCYCWFIKYFINKLQVIKLILCQWCPFRVITLGVTAMASFSATFLLILRKLWVIVLFRVLRRTFGTIFLLKLGVPILLNLVNCSLRRFYLRKLFIDTLLFACIYLFILLL